MVYDVQFLMIKTILKSNILITFFTIIFAVVISELLVYLQIKLFWSDNHNEMIYYIGFWTPLIDAFFVVILLLYIKMSYSRKLDNYITLVDKNIITSSTDLEGNITDVSEAFCKISGYSEHELLGKNHRIIKHPDMYDNVYKDLWDKLNDDLEWEGEIRNLKKDGTSYWVKATIYPRYNDSGVKEGYTAIRQDITDKKIIEKISLTDGLTGIFNRRHFNELFPKAINSSKRTNELFCFLIIDIDNFKDYNDTYGHQKGDEVLKKVASAINKSTKRVDDYCFRLGGEEFAIIFKSDSKDKAVMYSETIKEKIERLKIIHEKNSASDYITISIGLVCIYANEISNHDDVFKQADDLLYKAKENGRNIVCSNF